MKKLIIVLSFISISTFSIAQGQRPQRPERPSTEQMVKMATKELSLTDGQVNQWTVIHKKYESSMKDRSKAQSIMKKMGLELETTLTDSQIVKFNNMRKKQGPPPGKN